MVSVLICAKIVVLPGGNSTEGPFHVLVRDGQIFALEKCKGTCSRTGQGPRTEGGTVTEATGDQGKDPVEIIKCHLLTPGFIDIHNHGMGGEKDVTEFWLNPEYTKHALPKFGTTSFLATIVFPFHPLHDKMNEIFQHLNEFSGKAETSGAVLEGIHSEGPVVSDLGGLPGSYNDMSTEEFGHMLDKMPSLKIMTISPHEESKVDYSRLKLLLDRGIVPALGHDRQATELEILTALSQRKTQQCHITHLFNVCNFHHRNPGLVNFGLVDEFPKGLSQYKDVQPPTVEVIGDLRHVCPLAISLLLKSRHFTQIAFVTDCVSDGAPGKRIKYSDREMEVSPDGLTLSVVGTQTLAGSCATLLDAFRNLVNVFDVPVGHAVAMLSENPARIAKLDHTGSISVGKRADLLLFDENRNLMRTIVNGRTEYSTLDSTKK